MNKSQLRLKVKRTFLDSIITYQDSIIDTTMTFGKNLFLLTISAGAVLTLGLITIDRTENAMSNLIENTFIGASIKDNPNTEQAKDPNNNLEQDTSSSLVNEFNGNFIFKSIKDAGESIQGILLDIGK